ncbi:MAG: phosphoribosylglycinamide formyltransferase [Rhodobacteraceae bacterium]|nr:phosphoribosylglycinamide formyltransferase [Paracoccaceae bacterium]
MKRVAILISGGGSNMVELVRSMQGDYPARACLVLSNVPDAGGLAKAREMSIDTQVVDHREHKGDRAGFEAALNAALDQARPDIICLAGFMRVLSADFISRWAGKILNIHPSLLPKYKGLNTHSRALEAGDSIAGCSVHEVTAELDGGPILGQAQVPVLPGDTAETLAARVLPMEHILYPLVLRRFAGGERERVSL